MKGTEVGEERDVRFAESDGVSIAYTSFGAGSTTVVYTPPWVSNVELDWELEEFARVMRHGSRYNRVIHIDKRGVGLSDRTNVAPTLEERVADTLAVMDAENLDHGVIAGVSEGSAIALALAAQFPERVEKLILGASALPGVPTADFMQFFEEGDPEPQGLRPLKEIVETWGTAQSKGLDYMAPDVADDPRVRAWARRAERQSASPGALQAHMKAALTGDVRPFFEHISCPTHIVHSRGDLLVPVACSRYLASQIPHATLRVWDDANHVATFSPNWREIQNDLIEFATGVTPSPASTSRFGVVLFTDIANSTRQAAQAGDEAWARLIRAHDTTADRVITNHNGRRIKSTGDGLLAIFTDPGQAIACAVQLQNEIETLGLQIRAGLHAGQVEHHSDGDITGIAVNLAARVEAAGQAGEVCISQTMRDLVQGTSIQTQSLGTKELKGITQPVELFRVLAE